MPCYVAPDLTFVEAPDGTDPPPEHHLLTPELLATIWRQCTEREIALKATKRPARPWRDEWARIDLLWERYRKLAEIVDRQYPAKLIHHAFAAVGSPWPELTEEEIAAFTPPV